MYHCTDQFMVILFSKLRIKLGLEPLEIPDSSADTEGKVHLCIIYVTGQFWFKVSAPANSAHFRWYTDIQCKSIIYMLDNNIAFWSIRNKTSEKIVRLHHSKGVILITPWGWHGKGRIQISQKPQQFVGKMKCHTNRDVKSNNPVFDQGTAPRNTPSRGQFVVLSFDPFLDFSNSAVWWFHSLVKHRSVHQYALCVFAKFHEDIMIHSSKKLVPVSQGKSVTR